LDGRQNYIEPQDVKQNFGRLDLPNLFGFNRPRLIDIGSNNQKGPQF